jgi:hypothetical protein
LSLHGCVHGDGATLQEAADRLLYHVLAAATVLRESGLTCSRELGPVDLRWLEFLYDVGALATRGADARARVLGPDPCVTSEKP